ncbi:MAG: hypothetical protein KIT58_04365 [Planctomycetota bacterium]|nr:hypothetical protein [Planctomycetota bacterium]
MTDHRGMTGHGGVDPLWLALDLARCRPEPGVFERLKTPPWESTDEAIRAAWAALTHPANIQRLEARLTESLNATAQHFTEVALEQARALRASPAAMINRLFIRLQRGDLSTVRVEQKDLAGVPRLTCEASWPPHTRYIQFTPCESDLEDEYGLLWGQFSQGRAPGDFDSRALGDLTYALLCVEVWLTQGSRWEEFPPFDATRRPALR